MKGSMDNVGGNGLLLGEVLRGTGDCPGKRNGMRLQEVRGAVERTNRGARSTNSTRKRREQRSATVMTPSMILALMGPRSL